MNIREGMRRLALLVGVLGAILGCFVSYATLRDALAMRAHYEAFELLENSEVVKQERKALEEQRESFFRPWAGPWDQYLDPPKDVATTWKAFSPKRRDELLVQMTPEQKHKLRTVIEQQTQQPVQDPYADIAVPFSRVNKEGIKTILWTKDLGVESIETDDGSKLYPTVRPARWSYLLVGIFPLLGFIVPWCSIRALAWVGIGFAEKLM